MKSSNNKNTVLFLLDRSNSWIEKYLKNYLLKFPKKNQYKISKNPKSIKNKIVFALSYTKILKNDFLQRNKEVLIVHPSNLPKDRGFAPVQQQVLRKKNLIHVALIRAVENVDEGPVAVRGTFLLKGHELSEEIREKQAAAIFKVVKKFLQKYPNVQFKNQKGVSTYNKKRHKADSELNINKSIKSQFNLLRIVDNKLYPAFFKYKKNIYCLKITKDKK
jgi:methionyl-tRNA formyltransferase